MIATLLLAVLPTQADTLGFEPLFNGTDLSGWKVPEGDNGHWRVIDEGDGPVIDYDAGSEAAGDKNLVSERTFKDYVLELEWRFSKEVPMSPVPIVLPDGSYLTDSAGERVEVLRANPDSGVYMRGHPRAQLNIWGWPVGGGEMYSYRIGKNSSPELRQAVTPRLRADKPYGEWNRFTAVVVGNQVTVLLNDQTVIDRAELPEDFPAEGPIVLQHHGGYRADGSLKPSSAVVQFRNIRIKELPTAE